MLPRAQYSSSRDPGNAPGSGPGRPLDVRDSSWGGPLGALLKLSLLTTQRRVGCDVHPLLSKPRSLPAKMLDTHFYTISLAELQTKTTSCLHAAFSNQCEDAQSPISWLLERSYEVKPPQKWCSYVGLRKNSHEPDKFSRILLGGSTDTSDIFPTPVFLSPKVKQTIKINIFMCKVRV